MDGTRFTTDHLWLRLDGTVATIGLTRFAVDTLGDVALVHLPQPGQRVQAGGACAAIETVKAASDAPAPLDGVVLQANPALASKPALVSCDPEGAGWLYRLSLDGLDDFSLLMDRAAYRAFVDAL